MVTSGMAWPSTIDDVTAQWLTVALDSGTVTDVRAERIAEDTGFSSLLYRLHLEGDGVPSTVIVKLPALSEARGAMELLGGYQRELSFYRHVAGSAPIQTPHVYAAHMVDGSAEFVLVLEDLCDWENADHLAGLSLDRVRVCIEQLAGLHAWSSDSRNAAVLEAFPSIDTAIVRDLLIPAFGPGWQIYLEHSSKPVSAAVEGFAERFTEAAGQALDALSARSMLLHGDIRADNMFFEGDRLKVVDFQFAARGAGAADIAYLVSQGLPTEVRRGHDEELVCEYLAYLSADGVTDYSFDEAWRHYRFAVAYLMVLPVITLNGWDAMPERSRALCLKLTERAVATIEDIGALEVFS
ncbi:aminoglycoside/choline kinase family phosphotransferase [Mycobacterium sp. OAS707]|uniref:phosphotransferase n=1 Tax=unclassified Mycobacterium TaxID=2642494 RepID=UPI00178941FA|nr:phosphotransferase [Mycobacterium sp. OAS707]MBE1547054.1 aminoglycoside/choline kinase family phosphotransferase [Mycobacterium sp. OAS707]